MEHHLEENRVYYQHDAGCDQKTFTEPNDRGLRTCLDCAGVFDAKGKGVAVTDKRFDENWVDPNPPAPEPEPEPPEE